MVYYFTWLLGRILVWPLFRITRIGKERVPRSGGVILASNHLSYLDPLVLGITCPRKPIRFMARESLYRNPVFRLFLWAAYTFPVKRGGADRGAWRHFENLVATGQQVSFFPEGTRSEDGQLLPANPGAGMLIHRCTGATVIPVRITGTDRILNKAKGFQGLFKVTIAYGSPVDLSAELALEGSREVYQRVADKVMAAIAALPGGSDLE